MRKSKSYDQVLKACLAEIEAGAAPEAVISMYPDHATRLRSDLGLWLSLSASQPSDVPPGAETAGRAALKRALAEKRTAPGSVTSLTGGFSMRFALTFAAGGVAVLGALFFGGALDSGSDSTAQAVPFQECVLVLDFTGDGMLDVNDVIAFRDAIENQDLAFDFNSDGTVDVFDVLGAVTGITDCLQNLQPSPPPLP